MKKTIPTIFYLNFLLLRMFFKVFVLLFLVLGSVETHGHSHNKLDSLNGSHLAGIEFPDHMSFNAASSVTSGCNLQQSGSLMDEEDEEEKVLRLQLKHRRHKDQTVQETAARDRSRIHTIHKRIIEKKNQENPVSRLHKERRLLLEKPSESTLMLATLESGVSLGSGEYFMDVFAGTPPKHFSLILDTGSDLNWIQCAPCFACFEQHGPYYDPKESTSFRNISCRDPRCHLVTPPSTAQPCKLENQTCPYFYWYGDSSNTTGDFATETFTVNLTSDSGKPELQKVENVMFGCGHWNRGLFKGAAGLLGFGRGPLSFSSQLQTLYGHSFSYCLVDRNSDTNVTSKLIFGEDKDLLKRPNLNFTSLVTGKENPVDTFYYVQVKSILVGDEILNIPNDLWSLSSEGAGGTIIDSGTTLSYFAEPAYGIIKEAFVKNVKKYTRVKDFPILDPCYNVSRVEKLELPELQILFGDGAVWSFPVENSFISITDEVVCLAILGTPRSAISIIGNYQQQNFHILYDTKNSRLGFAPRNCAHV